MNVGRAWSKHLARVAQRHRLLIYPHHLTWSLPGELTELEARWGNLPGLPLDCCQLLLSVRAQYRGARCCR